MTFELYNYRRCPFCIRVRLVFLYKEIPFETKDEKLRDWTDEFKEFYGDRKPTVPLLLHDGRPVFESLDIVEYIEDAFPDDKTLSKEDFRLWGDWSADEFRDAVQMYKYGEGGSPEQGAEKVQSLFEHLESKLDPFLTGYVLALADFAVWPFIRQAFRVTPSHVKMGPKLTYWYEHIEQHEKLKDVMKKQSNP